MARIASPIKSISELMIYRIPSGRAVKVSKAIKYEGMTFILGENGKIYSNAVKDCAFYTLSAWHWAERLVYALARLGVLPKKDADAHMAACRAADARRHRNEWAESFRHSAEKLGIKLTAKQEAVIKQAVFRA